MSEIICSIHISQNCLGCTVALNAENADLKAKWLGEYEQNQQLKMANAALGRENYLCRYWLNNAHDLMRMNKVAGFPIDCIKEFLEKSPPSDQSSKMTGEDCVVNKLSPEAEAMILDDEPEWKCPHCGSTKGTWFDRSISIRSDGKETMATRCEDCGHDVDD